MRRDRCCSHRNILVAHNCFTVRRRSSQGRDARLRGKLACETYSFGNASGGLTNILLVICCWNREIIFTDDLNLIGTTVTYCIPALGFGLKKDAGMRPLGAQYLPSTNDFTAQVSRRRSTGYSSCAFLIVRHTHAHQLTTVLHCARFCTDNLDLHRAYGRSTICVSAAGYRQK